MEICKGVKGFQRPSWNGAVLKVHLLGKSDGIGLSAMHATGASGSDTA